MQHSASLKGENIKGRSHILLATSGMGILDILTTNQREFICKQCVHMLEEKYDGTDNALAGGICL